jgi:hypothetical protein
MNDRQYGMKFVGLVAHECDVCDEVTNDVGLYAWSHNGTGERVIDFRYCLNCAPHKMPVSEDAADAYNAHIAALQREGNARVTPIIVDKADLNTVELVRLASACETFIPPEGRPVITHENLRYVTWSAMEKALKDWEQQTTDPNNYDIIIKVRNAAKGLSP